MWNAKNFGISVRGFGLLLGQLFLYFITWYYLYNNSLFLIGLFLISFCIVLSSQFTFQFILLSSVFLFILYEYIIFLFIPVCAILIFIILMPKVSWNFLMGQFGHKFNYYRFIAPKGILKERYSIWRDFIWDFWLCLFQKHDRPLAYIYKNQAVDSITGFPFLSILLIYFSLDENVKETILGGQLFQYISIPICVCIAVFILTSFRKTRFLGEPQRYIEFAIPYISILSTIIFFHSIFILIGILLYSFILATFQIFFLQRFKRANLIKVKQKDKRISTVKNLLRNADHSTMKELKFFSNNVDLVKYFFGEKIVILQPLLTSEYTGSLHFSEIFPETYGTVSPKVFFPLLREFNIDWFLLDKNRIQKDELAKEDDSLYLEEIERLEDYIIFRICLKS